MPFEILLRRAARAFRLLCVCAVGTGLSQADAQTLGTSDIQSILSGISQGQTPSPTPTQSTAPPLAPSTQTMQPVTSSATLSTVPSGLEVQFSARTGVPLQQFGYDVFGVAGNVTATQVGATQDSYILGAGDQLQIIMVGHESATYTLSVDRDGRIVLLNLPPITAAGRTLGEVRAELSARIAAQFLGTKSFISVATVRQISVLVTGEVASPGLRTLTALNTPLDALILSGGIKKTGSLRAVYVVRGTRRIPLDIYSVISHGTSTGVGALTEGDRIVVPPLGGTVAITGLVRRPGIYELPPQAARMSAKALLDVAGGVEIAGAKRLSKLALQADGRMQMVSVPSDGNVANGEVLFVDANRSSVSARISLNGEVSVPGVHALGNSPRMSGLLRDTDDLGPNAYSLFAVIIRHDPATNFLKMIPFSIKGVFDGADNPSLIDNDAVYVFTNMEIQTLSNAAAGALYTATQAPGVAALNQQQTTSPSTPNPWSMPSTTGSQSANASSSPQAPNSQALAQMATAASALSSGANASGQNGQNGQNAQNGQSQNGQNSQNSGGQNGASGQSGQGQSSGAQQLLPSPFGGALPSNSMTNPTVSGANTTPVTLDQLAQRLGVSDTALTNLAANYLVWVNGEVISPGPLLAASDASLASIIDAAGGLQRQADLSGVTVTSTQINAQQGSSRTVRITYSQKDTDFSKVALRPFDSISIRPVFSDRIGESITLSGQIRYPGVYEITRDERLSSVLARAGGLTDEAYAYGAIFTRQSAAVAEQQANQREATMLMDEIATISTQVTGLTPPPNLSYLQTMATTLQHQPALGRISISIDPAVLEAHADRDPLLETGDAIYIPKRPSTVAVTGEVLNSGAFAWRPNLTMDDYMDMAGGETDAAEDSATFVIMPDGTAVPASGSWWSFGRGARIPPGATIVVPRDPQPFDLTTFLVTFTDIASKVAITAASLAVLKNN